MAKLNVRNASIVDAYDEGVSLAGGYIGSAMEILTHDEWEEDDDLNDLYEEYCNVPMDEVPASVREALGWGEFAPDARAEWDRLKTIAHGYERWAEVMVA